MEKVSHCLERKTTQLGEVMSDSSTLRANSDDHDDVDKLKRMDAMKVGMRRGDVGPIERKIRQLLIHENRGIFIDKKPFTHFPAKVFIVRNNGTRDVEVSIIFGMTERLDMQALNLQF